MYGQPITFDLPIRSLIFKDTSVPVTVTSLPTGLRFDFEGGDCDVYGSVTALLDGQAVVRLVLDLEVGDWGFGHTLDAANTATLDDTGDGTTVDLQTRDTLRSVLYSVLGYAAGHGAKVTGALPSGDHRLTA